MRKAVVERVASVDSILAREDAIQADIARAEAAGDAELVQLLRGHLRYIGRVPSAFRARFAYRRRDGSVADPRFPRRSTVPPTRATSPTVRAAYDPAGAARDLATINAVLNQPDPPAHSKRVGKKHKLPPANDDFSERSPDHWCGPIVQI